MPTGLAVAIAGGLGAAGRYMLDYYAGDRLEPHHQVYVTLAINLLGSMLLGLLIGIHPDGRVRIVLGIGFLASFTTFSTLIAQTHHALDGRHYTAAILLVGVSIVAGLAALWAGIEAGRGIAG